MSTHHNTYEAKEVIHNCIENTKRYGFKELSDIINDYEDNHPINLFFDSMRHMIQQGINWSLDKYLDDINHDNDLYEFRPSDLQIFLEKYKLSLYTKIKYSTSDCELCNNTNSDNLIMLKECSHFFHQDCIDKWCEKNTDCPTCHKNMYKNVINQWFDSLYKPTKKHKSFFNFKKEDSNYLKIY